MAYKWTFTFATEADMMQNALFFTHSGDRGLFQSESDCALHKASIHMMPLSIGIPPGFGEAKQKTEKTGDDDALTEETLYECEGAQSG